MRDSPHMIPEDYTLLSKWKVMRINSSNENPITVRREQLEEVDSFKYHGSVLTKKEVRI